ncbi:restriction endonuclease [Streptomyces sp. URMC 129]|uniref:restriction endonuclease n=1 Tax=Streptomyces sp. URMC 129 TaxID=3423407 RepID=UPI003F1C3DEC
MIDIPIGQPLKRSAIHDRYGGSRQGGICSAPSASAVFLFTDPSRGPQHGYSDHWGEDGCYHYSGEGQTGDQVLTRGNLAILRHVDRGTALHLFRSVRRSVVERVGEFALSDEEPWYSIDAPDGEGRIRRMIIFRLVPVGETLPPPPSPAPIPIPSRELVTEYVPLEQHFTERVDIQPSREPYEAERREGPLVHRLREYLEGLGHKVTRNRIRPIGEVRALYTDLYDVTDNLLVEAKGSVTREAIRMAVGQLYDYRRHIPADPRLAVLVPEQPRSDLIDLCAAANIATMWPSGATFESHQPTP